MTLSRSPDHGDTATAAAGRELDARVAEKVFGFPVKWLPTPLSPSQPHYANSEEGSGWLWCRPYSTDIASVWTVIDAMMDKRGAFSFHVGQNHESLPCCVFEVNGEQFGREGTSIPHAICLAALAALQSPERVA